MNRPNIKTCFYSFYFVLAAGIFLFYAPALFNQFNIDDFLFLEGFYEPYFQNLGDFFRGTPDQHYTPLTYLITTLLFNVLPHQPVWFHLSNILLFYICCALLFALIKSLSKNQRLAAITATLFALHPVNVIIVDRITFTTSLLFWLACMLAAMLLLWQSLSGNRSKYWLSLLLFLLALLTLETAVLFPLYAFCLLIFLPPAGQRPLPEAAVCPSGEFVHRVWRQALIKTAPFFLLAAAYLILWLRSAGQQADLAAKIAQIHPSFLEYFSGLSYLIFWYIRILLWPQGIVFIRNIAFSEGEWFFIPLLIAAAVLTAILLRRWGKSLKSLSVIWFLLGLSILPVAIFAQTAMGLVIEPHWFFFSSIGFFVLAGISWLRLEERWPQHFFPAAFVLLLVFLAGFSQHYHKIARTEKSLCLHWLKYSPDNPIALMSLGKIYAADNNFGAATDCYQRILTASQYNHPAVYNQLAMLALRQNDLAEARKFINAALKHYPEDSAYNTLGAILLLEGKTAEAKTAFAKAITLSPGLMAAQKNLAALYITERNYPAAISVLEKFITFKNSGRRNPEMAIKLAAIYMVTGKNDPAYALLTPILQKHRPETVFVLLGVELAHLQADQIAMQMLNNAIRLYPKAKELYLLLGTILANNNHLKEAILVWQKGQELDTADSRFQNNIQSAAEILRSRPNQPAP